MKDEFYVGYADAMPPQTARFLRRTVGWTAAGLVVLLGLVAAVAASVGQGRFEFGTVREFEGVLQAEPLPFLSVADGGGATNHLLVGTGKHGLPCPGADVSGRRVRLRGTLIERDGRSMIEVAEPGAIRVVDARVQPSPAEVEVGTVTLEGELVDTKCYLGVICRSSPCRPGAAWIEFRWVNQGR